MSESSFTFWVWMYMSFYFMKWPRMKPDAIITGKKPIITSAILYPTTNATIIPLTPMLTLFRTDVMFVIKPCCTFEI